MYPIKTYVDKHDSWLGILAAAEFSIFSISNRLKGYSTGQLVFGYSMIIYINHKVDWEQTCQRKQTQINKYNIHKNNKRVDHDYKVEDEVMLTNNGAYKYKTTYNKPFVIMQCFDNDTVTLKCGAIQIRHNISCIKPYTSDTNVENINLEKYV